jgi:nicotinamidase-related amidase
MPNKLVVRLRQQRLERDGAGYLTWAPHKRSAELVAVRTALVLCDVWDRHWCRGAGERLAALLPRMNQVVRAARAAGVLIVHAPSDTIDFYAGLPARKRVLEAPPAVPPMDLPDDDPPQPIDASDGGCDTGENVGVVNERVWTRQHPAIEIDCDTDAISDDGRALYSLYRQRRIENVIIMGVHTNMCILNRSFAIKQMVRWGFNVALVRDLTDTMYNPARPPYVSHDEGTRLTVGYIEKYWCPTVLSEDLVKG